MKKYQSIHISKNNIESILSLTPIQKGIYYECTLRPDTSLYVEQFFFIIFDKLDVELFRKSWHEVVKNNEILRSCIIKNEHGLPLLVIQKENINFIEIHDLSAHKPAEMPELVDKYAQASVRTVAALEELFLVEIYSLKENLHYMHIIYHHIICDGWSNSILLDEFFQNYRDYVHKGKPATKKSKPLYSDYVKWTLASDNREIENFWQERLADIAEIPQLSAYGKSGAKNGKKSIKKHTLVFNEQSTGLIDLSVKNFKTTPSVFLQTIWAIALSRCLNHKDIVFGLVVSVRPSTIKHIENLVGLCINTIPVRVQIKDNISFNTFLGEMNELSLLSIRYTNISLSDIMRTAGATGGAFHLFDHILVFENYPLHDAMKTVSQDFEKKWQFSAHKTQTNYDFVIASFPGTGLTISFEYNEEIFDKWMVEKLSDSFRQIVNSILDDPKIPLAKINLLTEAEQRKLIYEFNHTAADYPKDKTIHQLFAEQAAQTPDYIALHGWMIAWMHDCMDAWMDGDGEEEKKRRREEEKRNGMLLSYQELNEQSDHLAALLIEKGIQADHIVGIMMERSTELIIGMLGILKAGAAYLPIDPAYPQERIDYMLKDSNAGILINKSEIRNPKSETNPNDQNTNDQNKNHHPRAVSVLNFENLNFEFVSNFVLRASNLFSSNLAYIIYTSGSTGKPKGVMIEHRNVARLVKKADFITFANNDKMLLTGAPVFDITTFEIWGPLLNNVPLVLTAEHHILNIDTLEKIIKINQVTLLHLVPQLFNQVAAQRLEIFSGLRYFWVGGDLVRPGYINELRNKYPHLKILHMYGPTENTTFSTSFLIDKPYESIIPIGKPVSNSTVFIMDADHNLQPQGLAGELYVGGGGLSRGYLNKPELTAEKFIPNPYSHCPHVPQTLHFPTGKLFKTGDLARWNASGNIEFLGRADYQVKVRGYRIELGEVESVLQKHTAVKDVVVIVVKDNRGENNICAYVVLNAEIDINELRRDTAHYLPSYMVPAYFVPLDKLPLNRNGKVDRKNLPVPGFDFTPNVQLVAPADDIEVRLLDIWRELLGSSALGVTHNFFQSGGHSLKAITLTAAIHKHMHVRVELKTIFAHPTIRELAHEIKQAEKCGHTDIGNTERKEYYDLSPAQKRLYVLYRFEPAGVAYNMARMFMLDGRVDVAKLEKAFNRLINRHESLRTSFVTVHGEPVQKVHETVAFTIKRYESCIDKIAEITNNFIVPFDLTSAPLLRAGLVRFSETGHLLMIDMHHIIADGISVNIFVHDFMHLYGDETLIPLKLQYTDFAAWQKEFYQTTGIQKQQTYWLAKFSDEPPVANLPLDYPRPQMQDFTGALFHFSFDELISKNLYRVAATSGTTLYMVLLAAFNTLLYRYMRQEDIITGTPVAGRPHADLEKITGLFINTLALRNHPRGEICFDNFLAEVKQEALEAFQNQDYQFEELIEHLKIPRQVNRNPLFDIMFTLQDQNELDFSIPGLQITVFEHSRVNAKFDLTLFAVNTGSTIQFQFEYPVDLFKKSTMARLAGYFMNTLKIIGNNPGISLKNIEIIGEAEKKELLFTFNNTGTGFQSSQTIRELFDACATANPTKRALIYKDQQVTYRQLHDHAAHVGRSLVEKGLKDNEIIGVLLDHSPNLIIALLGILEAGAAYLPMDIEYPGERIKYMMRDSACRFVIIDSGAAVTFPQGVEPVFMEQLLAKTGTGHKDKDLSFPMPAAPGAIAYQVYTSGSTGLPKGCLITQKGLVHYIEWAIKHYTPGGNACFPLFTSIAFDLTVTSIFTPLLSGNTVVAYPKHLDVLARVCRDGLVNIIKLTPTHLNLLLDLDLTQCRLQKIIVGGEQLTTELAQKIHDKFQGRIIIYNEYGPTETVVGCMIHQFAPGEKAKGNANGNANANGTVQRTAVPIGVPIQDTQVYVLDDNLSVCPIGVTGEIYIGGPGVSPGYNNRPALTNERFIANPFNHGRGSYLYKTGDLGLFLEDMRIEYVGREDRQVKIHGYRIEPGEIEHKIKTYPGIKDALVRIKENLDHEKYLCAYLLSPGTIKEKDLRNYLAQDFPIYMIPQFFITLPSFPISANGKIAEQLLPLPQKEQQGNPGLPVNHIQEFLYSVWTQFLPITNFTVQDNFFEIGGNSFLLLKMHHKISETYAGVQVTDYFKYPSIQALAGYITGCEKGENKAPVNQQSQQSLQCSSTSQDIAVIGVAFNLPRAHTIAELYDVLKNKTDCISSIPPNRIADVKNYLAYKGVRDDRYFFTEAAFLPTICDFDYTFFNISKNEAVVMDPYQRLFLETAWHVFEDAGYPNEQLRGTRTGVFLGQPHQSDYYKRVKEIVPEMALVAGPGNINSIIAGRVSYLLDLKGPSLVVDTACSSSLIALHLACRALKNGECDMALVGGINLLLEPVRRHSEELPNIASPTGRAKTFSDDADGTGQGEGVIGILIKPYDRALADHDNIHAVIKGSAYNNDGSSIGITAPNGLRQEEVICAAWADAGIDPATISYIEAHGTGTILGDPIEVDSMSKAFAQYTDKKHFCGIGSIKTNYGHLDSAAGLLGLLKVIVSFRYRQLLPNVHFTKPNRKINFASSPVYVVDHLKEWTSSGNIPRRAGVSAFGLSGTNCHIVLEEPPLTGKKQNLYQDDRVVGRISIPLYPFEKKRCWLEIPAGTVECTDNIQSPYAAGVLQDVSDIQGIKIANSQQPDQVLQVIRQYIAGMFEIKEEAVNVDANYFDLGIDSISIIQLEHYVKKTYAADVTADELFDTLDTPRKLAQHIAAMTTPAVPKAAPVLISPQASNAAAVAAENKGDKQEEKQFLQRFVIKSEQTLTEQQKYHLDILEKKYTAKTGKSKAYSQSIRLLWANGRSIQGFTRPWKEFIYPIYVQEGQGVHIRDLDGNAYIDFAMGFGVNLLGYNHAVVTRVLQEQLEKGVVLGALTTLPGDVAALIHELTGVERVAFCNSGTESIMNLVRIARATTGKNKIALFAGSYHGTFDGVFVTKDVSTPGEHPIPRSLGIPNGMIDDVIILDYDSEKALDLIKAYAHELAAVLVEPVQSRNPLLQPHEFLQQLRILTEESGIALIFDEIITGFRIHPGGAQAYFNIQADLVAYGKVLGGGMPIGIFAGKAKYMDRVDGGMWNYHDDSSPSGFLVQIAGTFSHHPLAMAAAKAALEFLKKEGPALYDLLNSKTQWLADYLNTFFTSSQIPLKIAHFGSLFIFTSDQDPNLLRFLYYSLIEKGFYLWEGGTCFICSEHTEDHILSFIKAIQDSCWELLEAGCYPFTIIPRVLTTDYIKETYHQEAGTPWDSERMLHLLNHDADRREAKRLLSIEPGIEQIYPLSPMQGLVMVQNIRSLNTGHDVSLVEYSVSGNIDSENFKKAWQTVVMRHAILRTGFKWRKLKEPFQVVYKTAAVPLIIENFQDYSLAEKEIRYQEYLAKEKKQGFKNAPLFKLILVKYDETSWRHIFKYQNSLFDGWSSNILMHEFNSIYEGLQKNTPVTLPALRPYSNYIHWLQHQDPEKAKMFWCSQFNGFDSENTNRAGKLPALAVDHTFAGATLSMSFTENEIESIEHFSKKNKINTYTLCQGAWILTLAKYSHSTVFVFGVAVSGRPPGLLGSDRMVGLFTNVLPLPVTITKTMNLKLWLANIQSRVLETKNFEYVVTQQVSQWTGVPLAILQEAIYTRTLVFLNYPIKKDDPKENSMNVTMTNEDTYPQVPLRLYVHPRDNFTSILYYNKNAFQPEESQFLLENFKKNLLAIIHTDEETPIFSLINGVNNDN